MTEELLTARVSGEEGAISIRKTLKPQARSLFIGHLHFHTTAGELDVKSRQTVFRS